MTRFQVAFAVATALALASCAAPSGDRSILKTPDSDLIAARELARTGRTQEAESLLLAGRSAYSKDASEWRTYTLALSDLWLDAGDRDRACPYRFEASGGGEVVSLSNDPAGFIRGASGPRQAALAEALAAEQAGDVAGAAMRFAALRSQLDPRCYSYLRATTAAMVGALKAGRLELFLQYGRDLDRFFGKSRIILPGQEASSTFVVYSAYRAIAGLPPPYNTPIEIADRLAFLKTEAEDSQ